MSDTRPTRSRTARQRERRRSSRLASSRVRQADTLRQHIGCIADTKPMKQAWRYLAAGLTAFGVAGRPGHTVYFEAFAVPEAERSRYRSDAEAIRADWAAVGNDLRGAMDALDEEAALAEADAQ